MANVPSPVGYRCAPTSIYIKFHCSSPHFVFQDVPVFKCFTDVGPVPDDQLETMRFVGVAIDEMPTSPDIERHPVALARIGVAVAGCITIAANLTPLGEVVPGDIIAWKPEKEDARFTNYPNHQTVKLVKYNVNSSVNEVPPQNVIGSVVDVGTQFNNELRINLMRYMPSRHLTLPRGELTEEQFQAWKDDIPTDILRRLAQEKLYTPRSVLVEKVLNPITKPETFDAATLEKLKDQLTDTGKAEDSD